MAMQYQSVDPKLVAKKGKKPMSGVSTTPAPVLQSLETKTQKPQALSTTPSVGLQPIGSGQTIKGVGLSPINQPIQPMQSVGPSTKTQKLQLTTPQELPKTGATQKKSLSEFGDTIKAKYPEYADMDSEELGQKMLNKYPEYADMVEIDNTNFIENLGSGIAAGVTATGKLGKKLGISAGQKLRERTGKERLTPEQLQGLETNKLGQFTEGVTNWQTEQQKESVGGKIGETASVLGQALVMPTGVASIAKLPGVAKVAAKAPLLAKTIQGGLQGVIGQDQYTLMAEGRAATGKERLTAGLVGAGLPVVGAAIKGAKPVLKWAVKGAKEFFGKQAESLSVQGLLNAHDAKKIVRTLKETGEGDVGSIGRRALERGVAGKSTEEAIDVAQKIAKENYQGVRKIVSGISDKVGALGKDQAVAKAMTMVGKQADSINARVGFDAVDKIEIEKLMQEAQDGTLTLNGKQRAKELVDEFVNIYKKSGEVADTQIADVADSLRKQIRSSIEDIVDSVSAGKVNIREMNREVAVAKLFEEGINNKATSNELKQFAIQGSLGSIIGTEGKREPENPIRWGKILLGAFLGRQVGKLLGDPATMGKVAKMVDKLSMGTRKSLLEYIKDPNKTLSYKTLNELGLLRGNIKNLALPYTQNVDIPSLPLAGASDNKALLVGTNVASTPSKRVGLQNVIEKASHKKQVSEIGQAKAPGTTKTIGLKKQPKK